MEPNIVADRDGTYSVAIGEWILIVRATLDQARAIVRDIRIVQHEGRRDHAQV